MRKFDISLGTPEGLSVHVNVECNNIIRLDEFLAYSVKQVTKLPQILRYCRIIDIYP